MPKIKLFALLAALGLAMSLVTCAGVPLTAPGGTTLVLIANPTFVAANGGRSVVSAILTEATGTFVPNGTEVFFFTDLGTIEASAKTRDGVARVNFVADSRSGIANILAMSGGAVVAPTTSPSTPTSPATGAITAGDNGSTTTITVGSAIPTQMVLTASPQRILDPRYSEITANVFDDAGNPVRNVPVFFKISAVSVGGILQEELDSGGQPRFTDSSGQAHDVLRTRQNRADPQKTVGVTAVTANGVASSSPATVAIN